MGLINLFRPRETQKEFSEMTKHETRFFLANDLIERMIRIEQKLRASLGEAQIPFFQTEYYKGLTTVQKEKFKSYMRKKEKGKKWKIFFVGVGAFAFLGVVSKLTGNAVANGGSFSWSDTLIALLLVLALVAFYISVYLRKQRENRLHRHFSIMEKIIHKKERKRIN